MDRMCLNTPAEIPARKSETRLSDLEPDRPIVIELDGAAPLFTTPRELMRVGRLPGHLYLDEVEGIFASIDYERNGRRCQ
ncbi:hypothetical protein [Asticcacaulis solisilvae]|uniref:hypothetical protein n=1 Tax=Asticcacaulis solisilvae TaxID=1217274 RepID=UPI003FD722FB